MRVVRPGEFVGQGQALLTIVNPGDLTSTSWLRWLCISCGKTRSAAPLIAKMLRLDPVNPLAHCGPALAGFIEGLNTA